MADPVKILEGAGTAPISDALGRAPGIPGLKPVYIESPVAGEAYTVSTSRSNWLPVAKALEEAPPGSVIVVYDQDPVGAVWGELMSRSAAARGVRAAVVYGYTRDTMEIRGLKFPLYSLGVTPRAGAPSEGGSLGVEVSLGGVRIRPGDIVVMDQDGVIVVPRERLEEAAGRVKEIARLEEKVRSMITPTRGLYRILVEEGLIDKIR